MLSRNEDHDLREDFQLCTYFSSVFIIIYQRIINIIHKNISMYNEYYLCKIFLHNQPKMIMENNIMEIETEKRNRVD